MCVRKIKIILKCSRKTPTGLMRATPSRPDLMSNAREDFLTSPRPPPRHTCISRSRPSLCRPPHRSRWTVLLNLNHSRWSPRSTWKLAQATEVEAADGRVPDWATEVAAAAAVEVADHQLLQQISSRVLSTTNKSYQKHHCAKQNSWCDSWAPLNFSFTTIAFYISYEFEINYFTKPN